MSEQQVLPQVRIDVSRPQATEALCRGSLCFMYPTTDVDAYITAQAQDIATLRASLAQSEAERERRETKWAHDFRRKENRMARFLDRAEKAEAEKERLQEELEQLKLKIANESRRNPEMRYW